MSALSRGKVKIETLLEGPRLQCAKSRTAFWVFLARPVSRTAPGGVHRRGAVPLVQPKSRPRVAAFASPPSRPQPRAAWAKKRKSWCFPRRLASLGPARGACSCGLPPTPSAPGAWPQPQRRSSSFSHPTCKYFRTFTPAPPFAEGPGGGLPAV